MPTELPTPATLDEAIALLQLLWAENVRLAAQVQGLEARLGQNSSNSSRPPSSDPPQAPRRARRAPSGRPPGGQPGHERHLRPLLSPEQVDAVVDHWPTVCAHCA